MIDDMRWLTQKRVYTCGPIHGFTYDEANDWRTEAARQINNSGRMHTISPMRAKQFLKTHEGPLDSTSNDNPVFEAQIFYRDTFDVRTCDAVLACFIGAKAISGGSMYELGMAHALNKPVVVIIEAAGNPHDHLFVRQTTPYRCEDMQTAVRYLKEILHV